MRVAQRVVVIMSLMAIAMLTVACGANDSGSHDHADHTHHPVAYANASLFQYLGARNSSASVVLSFEYLSDLLSNTEYVAAGDGPIPFSPDALRNAVIYGTVVDVQPGRAFVETETAQILAREREPRPNDAKGDPHRDEVDFYDPTTSWRTVIVTVAVKDGLGTGLVGEVDMLVTLGSDADPDRMIEELTGLSEVVVPFNLGTDISTIASPGDRPQYLILGSGAFLGVVDEGRITFPALEAGAIPGFTDRTPTVDALVAAASGPGYSVILSNTEQEGFTITRSDAFVAVPTSPEPGSPSTTSPTPEPPMTAPTNQLPQVPRFQGSSTTTTPRSQTGTAD